MSPFETSPEDAAQRISQLGAIAVVKLGAKGALIQKGDTKLRVEPVSTQVVDTTAAGDMFAGGFLYGFTGGYDLQTCFVFGFALNAVLVHFHKLVLSF